MHLHAMCTSNDRFMVTKCRHAIIANQLLPAWRVSLRGQLCFNTHQCFGIFTAAAKDALGSMLLQVAELKNADAANMLMQMCTGYTPPHGTTTNGSTSSNPNLGADATTASSNAKGKSSSAAVGLPIPDVAKAGRVAALCGGRPPMLELVGHGLRTGQLNLSSDLLKLYKPVQEGTIQLALTAGSGRNKGVAKKLFEAELKVSMG